MQLGNLLIAWGFAILLGFALVFLIIKAGKKPQRTEDIHTNKDWQGLSFEKFYGLVAQLLEKMGLELGESYRENQNEAGILAKNPEPFIGGPVIVHIHFHPQGGKVTSVDVMNFAGNLVGDRRGKGIYVTNGRFGPEVATLPELPPMDLIDGTDLKRLFEKHGIDIITENSDNHS